MNRIRLLAFAGLISPLLCVAAAPTVEEALLRDPPPDAAHPPALAELTISSAGQRLPAHLYLASGAGPHPTVILLHGLPGNERNLDIAQALRRYGFNTLYFHFRGAWGAEGRYSVLGQLDDVDAVLTYLRDPAQAAALRVDTGALSVLGHSLGGYAALASGARSDDLRCVMALSPANLLQFRDSLRGGVGEFADLAAYADTLFMLHGVSAERFRSELEAASGAQLDPRAFGPRLAGKAVLLGVGEDDAVTPAATMVAPIAAAYRDVAGLRLESRVLPGDHAFSSSRVALTRLVLSWAGANCR